ncbi:O-antigen ligase family protein [Geomonas sp. Red32]|uniref:O-antigen ligase family protein n=1 Tax=Geomonas sp. Red32 TaxID=2912856 RepID=UPI00202CF98E|nr:O-antigen ligase family protein [Geomonas sp. Red32]MCM0083598.1 O-antigen ligase family protein [Geomonas sp. Red32]
MVGNTRLNLVFYTLVLYAMLTPMMAAEIVTLPMSNYAYSAVLLAVLGTTALRKARIWTDELVFNPATLFLGYFFIQGPLTVLTANSSVKIVAVNFLFTLIPCTAAFLVAAAFGRYADIGKIVKLLSFCIMISIASIVLDAFGYADFWAGKYVDLNPVRFGIRQFHGLMPWPNVMATMLIIFSIVRHILARNQFITRLGYLAVFATSVRAQIATAIILLILSFKSARTRLILFVLFLALIVLTFSDVKQSTNEFGKSGSSVIYRIVYAVGSLDILKDYPVFGIGLNRISDTAIWELDGYYFHKIYSLPTTLDNWSMANSDTSVTYIAEFGGIGLILFIAQFVWFIQIALRSNERKFLFILIPIVVWFYSATNLLFSSTFGVFYWFVYGLMVSRYVQWKSTVASS